MEGRVKNVVSAGYGFIDTKKHIDFFFHHTEFKGNWKDLLKKFVCGEIIIVDFDNDPDATQGPKALNVRMKDALSENGEENDLSISG